MITSTPVPDILSPEHHADPHASYEVLREEYPVVFHEGTGAWLVSRHEDCLTVFKSAIAFVRFSSSSLTKPLAFSSSP